MPKLLTETLPPIEARSVDQLFRALRIGQRVVAPNLLVFTPFGTFHRFGQVVECVSQNTRQILATLPVPFLERVYAENKIAELRIEAGEDVDFVTYEHGLYDTPQTYRSGSQGFAALAANVVQFPIEHPDRCLILHPNGVIMVSSMVMDIIPFVYVEPQAPAHVSRLFRENELERLADIRA